MATLERGFKAWAERMALAIRRELDLAAYDPLPPQVLVAHLGITLWTPYDVPGVPHEVIEQLLYADPWGWSGVSLQEGEAGIIIYNPENHKGGKPPISPMRPDTSSSIIDRQRSSSPQNSMWPCDRLMRNRKMRPIGWHGAFCFLVRPYSMPCGKSGRSATSRHITVSRKVWSSSGCKKPVCSRSSRSPVTARGLRIYRASRISASLRFSQCREDRNAPSSGPTFPGSLCWHTLGWSGQQRGGGGDIWFAFCNPLC